MTIFEFDYKESLLEIEEHYNKLIQLSDSLADDRGKFRAFSENLNIDISVLEDCIHTYEKNLTISCYTFSERLLKNLVYQLIGKGNHRNQYINNFIDKKLPNDRYSPNVKVTEIEKAISEIVTNFKLILPTTSIYEFKIYDELIKTRHLYAHANVYTFNSSQFPSVIKVLKYLCIEYELLLRDKVKRQSIQEEFRKIIKLSNDISNVKTNAQSIKHPKLKEIRITCSKFTKNYFEDLEDCELLHNLLSSVKSIGEIKFKIKKDELTNLYSVCSSIKSLLLF